MSSARLDHIVILVRSLDASLPWYSALLGLLGLDKTRDHVWWNGTVAFDIRQAEAGTRDYERFGPGLNHSAFTVSNEAGLDRVRDGMTAAGFEVADKQRFGAEIATFFKDPDGMRVEVAASADPA